MKRSCQVPWEFCLHRVFRCECPTKLTCSVDKCHVEVKRQQWFTKVLAEVALHCAGDGLGVPFKFVREVNGVQLASLEAVLDQLGGLG